MTRWSKSWRKPDTANDTDNALGAPDADREATTVHGVLLIIADLERRLEGAPLLAELGAQYVETGAAESQHGALLALDPVLVVEVGAGGRDSACEKDLLVCQRDVDGHGLRVLEAALADPGIRAQRQRSALKEERICSLGLSRTSS